MARVPEEELERLKREVSVQVLAEARGVVFKQRGQELLGLCPLHDDTSPSLVVNPSKNVWACLGACQTGGSVVDWVMKSEGVSFRHAVELLRERHPVTTTAKPVKTSTVPKLPLVLDASASDEELLEQVVAYYHESLLKNDAALAYLERRGLRDDELIRHFQLGFADRTLGYRLPQKNRKTGEELRGRLQKLGILRESGHEHFRGSVVVPIRDRKGRLVQMYGRKIGENLRAGTPPHLYLPGKLRGVFNFAGLRGSKDAILCESILDALTFFAAGFRHVTTSFGVNGFDLELLEGIREAGAERVFIAYDRDDAGDKAAIDLVKGKLLEGFECFRVQFPKGMDANEYARKVQPASKSLGLALEKAVWMGEGEPALSARALDDDKPLKAAKEAQPLEETPAPAPPAESLPLAAKAAPESASVDEGQSGEVALTFDDRRYRIRGLAKNTSLDVLRINLLASRGDAFHVDNLDLYTARQRLAFIKQAAAELAVKEEAIKKDLGKVLLHLEQLQDAAYREATKPKDLAPTLTPEEEAEAMALLEDPRLLERILEDFARIGVIGEETNKLVGYLAATSRKLEDPLAVIIQSSSAAGKSSLMEGVLSLVPDEERVKYSAMTGQSLFYMGETNLAHKVLAIVEEEGAERASYALKLLQSEKELSIASTGKDPETGKLITHEYRVEGPVMIFLTTTAIEIDEELLNRCIVLTVDEDREQTRAIHELQRKRRTLSGLLSCEDKSEIVKLHQNAQRLLRPHRVVNPYAERLTFLDDKTRTRRDHTKYLGLIEAIALLHQHQRPKKMIEHRGKVLEYIEVSLSDIELANRLCHEVLGRSLDELPPQTRRLLLLLDEMVGRIAKEKELERSEVRFTRREVREATGWGNTQLKIHLGRLEELEYLVVHRAGHAQRFVYELLYEGQGKEGGPFLMGLLDVSSLGHEYDPNRSGSLANRSGAGRPSVGPRSGTGRAGRIVEKLNGHADLPALTTTEPANARIEAARKPESKTYVNGTSAA